MTGELRLSNELWISYSLCFVGNSGLEVNVRSCWRYDSCSSMCLVR
uniref:Uncharacterized protein n=1 Tax=Picea glauca TaxID=3330 RepID=A0A124GNR4_PICGL|nr:hypothetical protein ABT39_MTgene2869 [Picea glauca]